MIFPWQKEQCEQLWRAKVANTLPQALLFAGIAGTGKTQFADYFSRLLLCKEGKKINEQHVAHCHTCRLITGKAHPDVLWVAPEKKGQAIKVDQIREINDFVYQSSFQGQYRVVLINPANAMNINAANALLKTLEEPAAGAILVLISHQPAQLPATILSRCQRLLFPPPKKEEGLHWLQAQLTDKTLDAALLLNLAEGAPLAALQLIEGHHLAERKDLFQLLYALSKKETHPLSFTQSKRDADILPLLDFILSWIKDLLRLQLGESERHVINIDYATALSDLKTRTSLKRNLKFMTDVQQLRGQLSRGINLNKQLVMDAVFIKWSEAI